MKLLVFQHIDVEHPGKMRDFLAEDGVEWQSVELDEGEEIPRLEDFDALWVMGGPMDVWDVNEHPWLVPEKAAIRRWVRELQRPFLGFCLGHQLLADALGGTCGPEKAPEIGVMDIHLTEAGTSDPLFAGMPVAQKSLQWHGVRVAQAPDDAVVLATSERSKNEAMRVGDNAWSMQYHVEVEPDTVANWSRVPAYRSALESALGADGLEQLDADAASNMEAFVSNAERLYRNFMRLATSR